ncbi:CIC11C00000001757 [Sungouiella intermedia]|uniref:CIC11C00000001757 n=1 Tax=Sungouiella intermedia TaxID=45354 RepID=A0A1L0BNA7_9ASCO|nr:CIC11C00000001757 [[Candida] intermedia]
MSWSGNKISNSSPTAPAVPPSDPARVHFENDLPASQTPSNTHSPLLGHQRTDLDMLRRSTAMIPVTSEPALGVSEDSDRDASKISAYARLDFDNFTFFVQTLQVVLGRKSNDEIHSSHHSVDVHLSSKKAISRRHAKIFYNFGTQRFEISIMGRNGAFVDDLFVEKGMTVPLTDGTKIQIGDIPFSFVLPSLELHELDDKKPGAAKPFNPSDALNLRTNLYLTNSLPVREKKKSVIDDQTRQVHRNSKADIVRRLSSARRKSHASTNDEINALLKELDSLEGEDDDFDPDLLDAEVRELLDLNNAKSMTQAEIEKEEDEIDKLVNEHNMRQGVIADNSGGKDTGKQEMDINMLDQEIASLAPLIDAQTEGLDPEKARDAEELKKLGSNYSFGAKFGSNGQPYYDTTDSNLPRTGPLMGKPMGPRMGKPATIQPPANRVYGRQPSIPMRPGGTFASTYQTTTPSYSYGGYNGSIYNPMESRPLPPKLEVVVETITSVPITNLIIPFKAITSNQGALEKAPICVFKSTEPPSSAPKIPQRRKDGVRKTPKLQNLKDIPEQFKTKPNVSILAMTLSVLRTVSSDKKGLTINEIHEAIKDMFPYFKYCPDGWQATVTHNIRFNKIFLATVKIGHETEWLWNVDDDFITEREKIRKKQQELAMAKAKESALKAMELRQRQRLDMPQYSVLGRGYMTSEASPRFGSTPSTPDGAKPKSIAELASEIKRDGTSTLIKTPLYFQRQTPHGESHSASTTPDGQTSTTNIKDQLAANRSRSTSNNAISPPASVPSKPSTPQPGLGSAALPAMNQDTKKSLTYLQKELFTLYKARKLNYNTAVTTEIITKALATTIAQVNIIGAKAGCGDNALSFLVEKAPQQVSKILDIALTKSIKEKQGLSSKPGSKESTPQPPTPSKPALSKPTPSASTGPSANELLARSASPVTTTPPVRPPSGLSKPNFGGPARPAFSGPSKPQSYSKPGALNKPPQFLSNKPRVEKRPNEDGEEPNKTIKLE